MGAVETTPRERRTDATGVAEEYPIYLAGEWVRSDDPLPVVNPYDGSMVGTTYIASREQLERAILAAEAAFETGRKLPTYDRVNLLRGMTARLKERRDEVVRTVVLEAGKPVR